MRKLLLILSLLLTCVSGAWATDITFSSAEIKASGQGGTNPATFYDGSGNVQTSIYWWNKLITNNNIPITLDFGSDALLSNYSGYLNVYGNKTLTISSPFKITGYSITGTTTGNCTATPGSGTVDENTWSSSTSGTVTVSGLDTYSTTISFTGSDGGNSECLLNATSFTVTVSPLTAVNQISTSKYYVLYNQGRAQFMNVNPTTGQVLLTAKLPTERKDFLPYIVRFVSNTSAKSEGDAYQLKFYDGSYLQWQSQGGANYVSATMGYNASNNEGYLPTYTDSYFNFQVYKGGSSRTNYFNGNNGTFTFYTSTGSGNCAYSIYEVDGTDLQDISYNLSLDGNETSNSTRKLLTYVSNAVAKPTNPALSNLLPYVASSTYYNISEAIASGDGSAITLTATSNYPFTTTSLVDGNIPVDAQLYRMHLRAASADKFARYDTSTGKITYAAQDATLEAADYFCFVGDAINGFKVYNLAAGGSVVMGADNPTNDADIWMLGEGHPTHLWALHPNSVQGFTLRQTTGTSPGTDAYLHDKSSKFSYWHNSSALSDAGSGLVIEDANFGDVTYNVLLEANGETVTSATATNVSSRVLSLPSSAVRDYCTYTYYTDQACTDQITALPVGTSTIYALCSFTPPFTVSTDFNTATWYYATLRGKYLRADDSAKDGSGRYATNSTNGRTDAYKWAFFGNPYDNLYVMNKNQGSSKYMYKDTQIIFDDPDDPTADNNALWAITSNSNGGFTLRNIGGGSTWYVNDAGNNGNLGFWNSSSGANDAGSNWLVEEANASDKTLLGETLTTANSLYTLLNSGGGKLGYPTTSALSTFNTAISTAQGVYDDGGDYYDAYSTLASAISTVQSPENIVYIPRTDKYYTIVNARGAMVYDSSHSGSVDTTNGNAEYIWYGSTTPDDTDDNNLWGFIEQDGNYYMYNVGKQQFASVGKGTYGGGTWIFSDVPAYITLDDGIADEIAVPKVRVRATVATTETTYTMSVSTGFTGPIITYDASGDGGVPMLFAESSTPIDNDVTDIMTSKVTDLTPYRDDLQDAIDAMPIGSGLNEYVATSAYTEALATAQTVLDDNTSTKGELQEAKSNLEATFSGLTLNMPASNKFYRIKGKTSGNYLASGGGNGSKFTMTSATDATTIFYYDGTILTNLSTGMCNGMNQSRWEWVVGESASTVVFQDGLSNGGYGIKSATCNFYDNGTTADRGKDLTLSGANIRYRDWYLTEITTLPIAIGSTTYATLCAPVALTIPSNVKAYYISALTEKEATLSEITTTIAANTPVILKATAAGTYNFAITTGGTDVSSSNKLAGQVTAQSVDANEVYTLQKNSVDASVVGLYPKAAGTMAGFKAYLPATALTGEVKGLSFIFADDNTTAIRSMEAETKTDGAIYNLAGQRVSKAIKGVYIMNGKKVFVK